jgi:hypothetical protein
LAPADLVVSILALASIASPIRGAEIDSLTDRPVVLEDSSDALERRLNDALEAGVTRANQVSMGCDERILYRELRRALATPFIGHVIAESLNEDERLDRRRIRGEDSIYRDLGLLDNISVHWKDLNAVVRVGEALIGVDKIGHFVVEDGSTSRPPTSRERASQRRWIGVSAPRGPTSGAIRRESSPTPIWWRTSRVCASGCASSAGQPTPWTRDGAPIGPT